MLDKKIILENFQKSINTYNQSAKIQIQMAKKIIELLPSRKYNSILEIGSYTGILTAEIKKNIEYQKYFALDIVKESRDFVCKIDNEIVFLNEDIEEFNTSEKFDLIVANASLQWCQNLKEIVLRLKSFLNENGILAIAIFSEENLFEIKNSFDVSLQYYTKSELREIFGPKAEFLEEKITLVFNSSLEILKHMKDTGVNSLSRNMKYCEIKNGLKILNEKYKNSLTYMPIYIID